jgi:phosphotransferase system IIA component
MQDPQSADKCHISFKALLQLMDGHLRAVFDEFFETSQEILHGLSVCVVDIETIHQSADEVIFELIFRRDSDISRTIFTLQ